ESLALSPGAEPLLAGAAGRELPGVLKMELLASMAELATDVCAPPQEGLGALRQLGSAAGGAARAAGLGIAAAGAAPRPHPAGPGRRSGPALPGVRRVRRHLRPAPGGVRAARARLDAGARRVHARARGRAPLATARARAVGQLALPRRRGDGPRLCARGGA